MVSTTDAPPKDLTYADLVKSGDDGVAQQNNAAAAVSYRQALALNGNDPALWLKLANVMLAQADDQYRGLTTWVDTFMNQKPGPPGATPTAGA